MLRKQSDERDPADWFYLGADRLKAADLLWQHEGLTAAGIELLQEAVERYLTGRTSARTTSPCGINPTKWLATSSRAYLSFSPRHHLSHDSNAFSIPTLLRGL